MVVVSKFKYLLSNRLSFPLKFSLQPYHFYFSILTALKIWYSFLCRIKQLVSCQRKIDIPFTAWRTAISSAHSLVCHLSEHWNMKLGTQYSIYWESIGWAFNRKTMTVFYSYQWTLNRFSSIRNYLAEVYYLELYALV